MTNRTKSPTAAKTRARIVIRQRMKAVREGKRVDSPHILASRLVSLIETASADNPGEWSDSYCEWVINQFADRYVELCRVVPIPVKAAS